jgi:hypothetical protein
MRDNPAGRGWLRYCTIPASWITSGKSHWRGGALTPSALGW